MNDAKKFLKEYDERNIPAYLERSRSGKGGHVWVFFEQPYPAIRSRMIFISILEQSGAFSVFDKGSSFAKEPVLCNASRTHPATVVTDIQFKLPRRRANT